MSDKKRGRKIVVSDKSYQWRVCVGGVIIWDAADKQHKATRLELTGIADTSDSDGEPVPILPGQVADWIRAHLTL